MLKRIVFATGNMGKLKEVKDIFDDFPFEIISMKEAGIDIDIEENGSTFKENAVIKADALKDLCDAIIIADDSGLVVDALNGEPGVYSARYLGEDTSFDEKMDHILMRMDDVPEEKRTARFVAAVAAFVPGHGMITVEGVIEGIIGYEKKGKYGFGYDAIFYIPERGCTAAELLPEEKNKISHRARALELLAKELSLLDIK